MGRKKGTKENPATLQDVKVALSGVTEKPFKIMSADLTEGFCNYTYEITSGVGKGRMHKVDGKKGGLLVDDALRDAIAEMNVHLACIDQVYKHSGVEFDNINDVKTNELTYLYVVTGFRIKGTDDNVAVIIIGYKYLDVGGTMVMETPKIPIDSASSYPWYNELSEIVESARQEVELYDAGKGTPIEEPDESFKQSKMSFLAGDSSEDGAGNEEFDKD